uniref:Uncharacterized protein n=1 Tax=Setaria viridis TaxID=4556 RepID=A0A4U6TFL7_SETVI|nr:hypothetical protein SEVIR_8G069000v2 [Setaria viridis]
MPPRISSNGRRIRRVFCPNCESSVHEGDPAAHVVPPSAPVLSVVLVQDAVVAPRGAIQQVDGRGMVEGSILQQLKWIEKLVCVCILLVLYVILMK